MVKKFQIEIVLLSIHDHSDSYNLREIHKSNLIKYSIYFFIIISTRTLQTRTFKMWFIRTLHQIRYKEQEELRGACTVVITVRKMEVTFCECLLFCGSSLTSSCQYLSHLLRLEDGTLVFFKPWLVDILIWGLKMANCIEELRGEKGFGQYGGPCQ